VAVGNQSMYSNFGGNNNVALGGRALYANVNGNYNTAVGFQSLGQNTSGTGNTATGLGTMGSNTDGSENVAYGYVSMSRNTGGDANTAYGAYSLQFNTNGDANTAIGSSALSGNTTGTGNTGLGLGANVSAGNLTNATAIGFGATVNASNKVRIGNAAVTVIEGQVPFTFPSDGRFKFNVEEDVHGLDFIMQLRPVTYQFDTKKFDSQFSELGSNNDDAYAAASNIRRSGFIAQEVAEAAKRSGYNFSGIIAPGKEQKHYSLSYDAFVVPIVKAMQEQQQVIIAQQKENEALSKKLDEMQREISEIKKLLQEKK
jgi:hypothetical protein